MPEQTDLLTTALEKLLYLESRLESAEAGREEAARERDRQRIAAQAARQALVEWQKRATDAEVAAEGAEREAVLLREALQKTRPSTAPDADLTERLREAQDRIVRYEREREVWLDRMVLLGRLNHDGDDLDLGSFIAELRAELLALRRGQSDRKGATVSDRPVAPDPGQLLSDAPTGTPELNPELLVKRARLSRPERTLALICGRDLRSDAASIRRRAVERLCEAGIGALNPIAITMLPAEPDAHVRVAIVKLLEATGGDTSDLAVGRALSDADARVRAAALEALARHAGTGFEPALADADPAVRRRALALLPRTSASVESLARALSDGDASVRRVAALALSRHGGGEAEALLQVAAESADVEVSTVAREALLRREATTSSQESGKWRRASRPPVDAVAGGTPAPTPDVSEPSEDKAPEVPEEVPGHVSEVDPRVLDEIRTSLRGRTIEELVSRLAVSADDAQAATERLVQTGALVRRGRKLYLA